jgi:hypothetical protein
LEVDKKTATQLSRKKAAAGTVRNDSEQDPLTINAREKTLSWNKGLSRVVPMTRDTLGSTVDLNVGQSTML